MIYDVNNMARILLQETIYNLHLYIQMTGKPYCGLRNVD
jgi:hypothetical protein